MKNLGSSLRSLLVVAATCFAISGTAFASQPDKGSSLAGQARSELNKATKAVDRANDLGALWIPARTALEDAQAAFERGELEEAISQARIAQRFVELGIEQLGKKPYGQH